MRSQDDPSKQPVYAVAKRFVARCLRADGSLFEPDRHVWSKETLDDLHRRFNLAPDESADSFEEKFSRQLAGANAPTIQLAAELVYVHFLIAMDIGEVAKRRLVERILSWTSEPVSIPDDLQAVLPIGVCSTGIAFKTYRPNQLWLLIDAMRSWKALGDDRRAELLDDPWAFKEFVEAVPQRAAFTQRQALLHLVFPAAFEDMVSRDQKALIIATFGPAIAGALPDDPDRALAVIRTHLAPKYGEDFAFWEPPIADHWAPVSPPPKPGPSVEKGTRRAWLIRGTEPDGQSLVPAWLANGHCAIGWHELGEMPIDIERAELLERLRKTYPDGTDQAHRNSAGIILRFLQVIQPGDVVITPQGQDLYVGVIDGEVTYGPPDSEYPWRRAVEWANPTEPIARKSVSDSLYARLRTMLTLTDVTDNITEIEGYLTPTPITRPRPTNEAELTNATDELASELHVSRSWLDDQIELLRRKRQLVFYGPPGTGKTYLAQALADHLTAEDGNVVFVQFHPSYSYEDFFEGFRPRSSGETNTINFELTPGPLRRLADAARADRSNPYILLIDELNRANLAKVFGELYFLLEYRDRAVTLQYSPEEEFQLPKNLYVIATMNTVDRSVALVDAAMRRRFYFTPLFPGRPPVDKMLRSWLQSHGEPVEVADLLDALNHRIGDPDAAIGPSYFMVKDVGTENMLRTVWNHAVLPQLEEYHFGSQIDVESRYNLDALRQAASGSAPLEVTGDLDP